MDEASMRACMYLLWMVIRSAVYSLNSSFDGKGFDRYRSHKTITLTKSIIKHFSAHTFSSFVIDRRLLSIASLVNTSNELMNAGHPYYTVVSLLCRSIGMGINYFS